MGKLRYKFIAIDVDGTLAYDSYPEVGEPKPHAIRVIEKIKLHGGKIAIWTCRNDLQKVRDYLEKWQIPYDVINTPFPEILEEWQADDTVRKIFADVYIDDRCIFTKEKGIDWLEVESLLFEEEHEINMGFSIRCLNCGSDDCETSEDYDYNYYEELEYSGTYTWCKKCGQNSRW